MKKWISIVLVIVVITSVLFLTFQSPAGTTHLSEMVRGWAIKIGYKGDGLQFRSDFHLVEYFVVGLVVGVFGIERGWKAWLPGVFGCGFGLIDETIKVFLPTREFGAVDVVKDFIGVWVAVAIVYLVSYLGRRGHRVE